MSDQLGLGEVINSEVAKKLYEDALSPGLKQLGLLLQNSMQTIRLGLFPIQWAAMLQGRFEKFLESVAAKVPEEDLSEPPPEVAGPILQAMLFVREENPVMEMFAELLARACDKTRIGDAHPAFANIIHQLSPDEAVILHALKSESTFRWPEITSSGVHTVLRLRFDKSKGLQQLISPRHISMYLTHLTTLGVFAHVDDAHPPASSRRELTARFDAFGTQFMSACVPGDWPPDAPRQAPPQSKGIHGPASGAS
jgi:hypothetical protein